MAPRVCQVCGQSLTTSEDFLCLDCIIDLPRTNIHKQSFNVIHQRLGHQCKVDQAAGWFYYRKGTAYAQMLVEAKYNNRPQLAVKLGKMCAEELAGDYFFNNIDLIVPMPMYWLKRMFRGYNQAEEIAIGISKVTSIQVENALKAKRGHAIQSRQNKTQRYKNISDTMEIKKDVELKGRNVLLVDDIITTGASMSEAVKTIQVGSPASISVLCLGLTYLS